MSKKEQFHFIGIGGIGMSGLARILLKKDAAISGSDLHPSYVTEGLSHAGAKIYFGHAEENVPEQATVIYSSDIKKDNPELLAAQKKNASLMHRSDLLLHLMQDYKTLTVAGTHGKTTTSALLTWVLRQADKDPGYAVGGIIPQLKTNAEYGRGEYFVAEADESDGTFLKYSSYGSIVTNIDTDHVTHYGSMVQLIQAFQQFVNQIQNKEQLFWCGDDENLRKLSPAGVSYGFNEHCQLQISHYTQKDWSIKFDIRFKGHLYKDIQLAQIGRHNALNGAAVWGLALSLGISEESIRKAFRSFKGVMRRCEHKGEMHKILFLDDYAHHPTEIKTTLAGIRRALNGRRLIVAFQPHRYSRTKECLGTFKGIFEDADELFVTEIFSAGEAPIPGVNAHSIIKEIESDGLKKCHYTSRKDLAIQIQPIVRAHDVVVSIGAGDITKLSSELMELFKKKAPSKLKVGIVFGGRSTEHEITFLSANHICNCVSADLYDVHHFGITKQGHWISGYDSMQRLKQDLNEPGSIKTQAVIDAAVMHDLLACDIFIPVFHGPYGEDGTIQGFFDILGKPYIGPDHTTASVSMDKALTKYLMHAHGISTLPFVEIHHLHWKENPQVYLEHIEQKISYPLYVKPVHLGSTIGVQRVEHFLELQAAIEKAFQFDYKIIVEQGLKDHREIEFAVLGNEKPIVFPPGEIQADGKVYDFDAKYGPKGMRANPKADLSKDKIQEGMELALAAYKAVEGSGMARVDFFLDADQKFWLNEINPIPGFTPISLYPKICEVNGVNGQELIDRMIIAALDRKRRNTILCRNR